MPLDVYGAVAYVADVCDGAGADPAALVLLVGSPVDVDLVSIDLVGVVLARPRL